MIDVLKHLVINKQAFAISQFFLRGGDVLGEKFFKIGPGVNCPKTIDNRQNLCSHITASLSCTQ